jgi:HD-GYP domain-containing protein (c-di-GMP phosphodiesterase class II)
MAEGEASQESRLRARQARESIVRGAMALVTAAEVRDPYTRGHSVRVGAYSSILVAALDPSGELIDRERLELACELHDVGKIGVPDAILNKEAPLNEEELALVRQHPEAGRRILEPLMDDDLILAVTHWHHERFDGTGYPDGLKGHNIPPAARVVALADTLDAMTCPRAYRNALDWEDALERIRAESGKGFDPEVVAYMDTVLPQLKRVHEIGERSLATAREQAS